MKKYLIGGARMIELGSDRRTEDTDYLVNVEGQELFVKDEENNIDYINANAHPFYAEIWDMAEKTGITPQLMFEMKSFSLVQHLLNFSWEKVATTEYDMKRLALDYNISDAKICKKYVAGNHYQEILNTIKF